MSAAPALGGTARPAREPRWRRLLSRRSLVLQCMLAGLAATAIVALVQHGLDMPGWDRIDAVILGGLAATLAASVLLHFVAARLTMLTRDARRLERDGLATDDNFAVLGGSAEVFRLGVGLQRLVQDCRDKLSSLQTQNVALGRELGARSHELDTLEDLSINLASKSDVRELVDEALRALHHTLEYSSASVWSRTAQTRASPIVLLGCRSPEASDAQLRSLIGSRLSRASIGVYETIELERQTIVENQPRTSLLSWLWTLIVDDSTDSTLHRQTRSWIALPLLSRHEVIGVLRVDHHEPGYFDAARSKLLAAVAGQTALALRHAQTLTREREVAVQAERNRIARELHDAVSQTLFAANMIAGSMARTAPPGFVEQARTLERLNRAALAEMRLLMFELRPDALEDAALADLLQHRVDALVCRGEIEVVASFGRGEALPVDIKMHVYRIAQEALANVSRHSGARSVRIEWRVEGGSAPSLHVVDDGCGFDPGADRPGHFGLLTMKERAAAIGAVLRVESGPGRGCALVLSLPSGARARPKIPTLPAHLHTTP